MPQKAFKKVENFRFSPKKKIVSKKNRKQDPKYLTFRLFENISGARHTSIKK
jgi:hypothetical protein